MLVLLVMAAFFVLIQEMQTAKDISLLRKDYLRRCEMKTWPFPSLFSRFMKRLTDMGCLLQLTVESLETKGVKGFALAALKKGLIHAVGSDMHNMSDRAPNLKILPVALQQNGLPAELAQNVFDAEYAILSNAPVEIRPGKISKIFGKFF